MTRPEFTSRAVPTWLDIVLPVALGGLWLGSSRSLKAVPASPTADPKLAEGDGQNNVQPSGHGARSELRARHPEKSTRRMKMSHMAISEALSRYVSHPEEKQEKWHEEMEHQHDNGDKRPSRHTAR